MEQGESKRLEIVEEGQTGQASDLRGSGQTLPVKVEGPKLPPGPTIGEPPPRRSVRWRLLLTVLITTAAAAGAAYWYWQSAGAPPVRYKTVRVDRGPVTALVTATGTVNPVISVQVGSQVSGIIQSLYADYNSVVKQGQVIAQVDPEPFRAKVDQSRANLRVARGNLSKAKTALAQRKLELDRMAELHSQEFVARADLDLARTNYQDALEQVGVSQDQMEQARAALASAALDLAHTTIYSPVNGIVVSRNVDVGQTVAASLQAPTLFIIAQDLTKMQVDANVSESDIGGITEGKEAEFTVDAYPNQPFKGTVVQVRNAPISIQNVVTYDVVIGADNRDLKLKPGMTANVTIVRARKEQTLRVSSAALRFKLPGTPTERKKIAVWVLDPAGIPRAVPIKPGISDATYTEVVEGDVREGDAAIIGMESAEGSARKDLPPGFGVGPKGIR